MAFLVGIKYGLILVLIGFGPSFFYLIRVSIWKGFRSALGFALGILITDIIFIITIFFGLSELFKKIEFQTVSSFIAGVVMLIIGIQYLTIASRTPKNYMEGTFPSEQNEARKVSFLSYVLKGIAINGMNPFTIITWIAILATITARKDFDRGDFLFLLIGLISMIVTADALKAFLADKIAKVLNPKTLQIIDKVLGVIFIALSFRFFYFGIIHYDVLL